MHDPVTVALIDRAEVVVRLVALASLRGRRELGALREHLSLDLFGSLAGGRHGPIVAVVNDRSSARRRLRCLRGECLGVDGPRVQLKEWTMAVMKKAMRAGAEIGKKALATDAGQSVVGTVVDKVEEIVVDKADDVAGTVKARAAKAGGRSPRKPAGGKKTTGRKKTTARKKTAARRSPARKKTTARKTTGRKKTGARKAPARKPSGRKTAARKSPTRKRTAARKPSGRKKTSAGKSPTRKRTTARRTTGRKKTSARKR